MHDEVFNERAKGGTRPCDEAATTKKSPPRFALCRAFAIVQRAEKFDALLELLSRAHKLERGARDFSWQAFDPIEHCFRDRQKRSHEHARPIASHGRQGLLE